MAMCGGWASVALLDAIQKDVMRKARLPTIYLSRPQKTLSTHNQRAAAQFKVFLFACLGVMCHAVKNQMKSGFKKTFYRNFREYW